TLVHLIAEPTKPTTAAPATTHAELIRNRNTATALTTKIARVNQLVTEARPNCQATTVIRARDPTTTPSKIAMASGDRRIFGSNGPLIATNRKPGKKIPSVARIAPCNPATTY